MKRREFGTKIAGAALATSALNAQRSTARRGNPAILELGGDPKAKPLHVGMLLYPGLTLLDLIGPQTVLSPFSKIHLIWKTREMIHSDSGLGMTYADRVSKTPPFTNVFAAPKAYDSFMRNGVWPNKTVLGAEMRGSDTGVSINKNGFVQTPRLIAIEMEVKDAAKGGWAFYGFENRAKAGKLFPKTAACYSCHEQHAAVDNTFVQFYPTLIETAKAKGTYKER